MDSVTWSDEGLGRGRGPRGTHRGAGLRERGALPQRRAPSSWGVSSGPSSSSIAARGVDLRGDSCSGWTMGPEVQQSHFNPIQLYFCLV